MRSSMRYGILLYGPPGAGKDTQGELLASALGIPHISVGELCRKEVAAGTELGMYIKPYIAAGRSCPGAPEVLVREHLMQKDHARSGYVMNGYARTLPLLRDFLLWGMLTHVVHLTVPDDVVRQRLADRGRHDDYEEAIEKKLAYYHEKYPAIAGEIAARSIPLYNVDGAQTAGDVTKVIFDLLGR